MSVEIEGVNNIRSRLKVNADDPIFMGHFPSLPVVPGVCMLQMVKEQLEDHLGQSLTLLRAANLKFLAVINPLENSELTTQISYSKDVEGVLTAEASISDGEKIFFKLVKAVYK